MGLCGAWLNIDRGRPKCGTKRLWWMYGGWSLQGRRPGADKESNCRSGRIYAIGIDAARANELAVREDRMLRIALAVAATVGLTFAADAEIGPLCQTPEGSLIVCHHGHSGVAQIGPLCQTPDGSLIVCHSAHSGVPQIGPLCQTPDGSLIVCHSGRG